MVKDTLRIWVIALLALVACSGSDVPPAVLSITPSEAVTDNAAVVTITTSGFTPAPAFDLNTGQGSVGDGMQILLIGPETLTLTNLVRQATGVFEGQVTPHMAGWYAVDATGAEGQHARLDHAFQVSNLGSTSNAVLTIPRVTSPVSTVYPGQTGVPLLVTVQNAGGSTAQSLLVTPLFRRDGASSSDFFASSSMLPVSDLAGGGEVVVTFMVTVTTTASPGSVTFDALASAVDSLGGQPLSVPGAVSTGLWTVLAGMADAGMDVPPPDAVSDVGADLSSDVPVDTGTDAGMDAGADTGVDASTDMNIDAGSDAGADAAMDVPTDTGVDAGTDMGTDMGTDTGSDAGAGTDVPITGGFQVVSVVLTSDVAGVDFTVTLLNGTAGVFTVTNVTPFLTPDDTAWFVEPLASGSLPITMMPGARATVHASASRDFAMVHWGFITFDASAMGTTSAGAVVNVSHAMANFRVYLP